MLSFQYDGKRSPASHRTEPFTAICTATASPRQQTSLPSDDAAPSARRIAAQALTVEQRSIGSNTQSRSHYGATIYARFQGKALILNFAVLNNSPANDLRVIPVAPHFTGMPVSFDQIPTILSITALQVNHFKVTYSHHGLKIKDLAGYAAAIYDVRQSRYVNLPFCTTEATWTAVLQHLASIYHPHNACQHANHCSLCLNPPRVSICFDYSQYCAALFSRGVEPFQHGMTFLDEYDATHATILRQASPFAALHYQNLYTFLGAPLVHPQLRAAKLPKPKTKPSSSLQLKRDAQSLDGADSNIGTKRPRLAPPITSITHPDFDPDPPATLTHLPRKARCKKAPRPAPLTPIDDQAMPDLNSVRGPKGRRLFAIDSAARPPPPEAYVICAEKPAGMTKAETDKCLTCVRNGRSCKGTTLTRGGRDNQLRCQFCSTKQKDGNGGRICYWKDAANGILTYGDAKAADPKAIHNHNNTKVMKAERAKKKLEESGAMGRGGNRDSDKEN